MWIVDFIEKYMNTHKHRRHDIKYEKKKMKRQCVAIDEDTERHTLYEQKWRMNEVQYSGGILFIVHTGSRVFHIVDCCWRCVFFLSSNWIYEGIFPSRLPHSAGSDNFEQEQKFCAPISMP